MHHQYEPGRRTLINLFGRLVAYLDAQKAKSQIPESVIHRDDRRKSEFAAPAGKPVRDQVQDIRLAKELEILLSSQRFCIIHT